MLGRILGWLAGSPAAADGAARGAGEVEQVRAFGFVELQRPGERLED
jgi:hypothetical protein